MSRDEADPSAVEVTVVVVDDHPMWRDAVARDLDAVDGIRVVGTAGDGEKAVHVLRATRPTVCVCDLQLPRASGVQVAATVSADGLATRVLVLSASGESDDVLAAVKAGATGYLVKSAPLAELVDAVRRTAAGEAVFSAGLAGLVLGEYRRLDTEREAPDGHPQLTGREVEVLRMVAKGLTAKQVADRLVLSHRTVQNHVQNTLTKLQLHNRAQLVRWAIEQGLDEQ